MKFYIFNYHRFDDRKFAYGQKYGTPNLGEDIRCPICNSYVSSLEWLSPYEIKLSKKDTGDFVYGTFDTFLVSNNVRTEFENIKLKGIDSFRKVNIRKIARLKDISTISLPNLFYSVIKHLPITFNRKVSYY